VIEECWIILKFVYFSVNSTWKICICFYLRYKVSRQEVSADKWHVWFAKITSKNKHDVFFFYFIFLSKCYIIIIIIVFSVAMQLPWHINVIFTLYGYYFCLQNTITYLSVTWVLKSRRKHCEKHSHLLVKYREYTSIPYLLLLNL